MFWKCFDLHGPEAEAVMDELLSGAVEDAGDRADLLTALNQRPVQVQELAGLRG